MFSVVVSVAGNDPVPTWSPPPPCPQHPAGRVVRAGTYRRPPLPPRQRYRCYPTPSDTGTFHVFTPPLPRQHVHVGEEPCEVCDEVRGLHHGETSAARGHTWSARLVAEGLSRLADGKPYGQTSRWARKQIGAPVEAGRRRKPDNNPKKKPVAKTKRRKGAKAKKVYESSKRAHNVWHIAADWCEVFAPVVWDDLDRRLRAEAMAERQRLDDLRRRRQLLDKPQVVLIDDVPVYTAKDKEGHRHIRFFVLVIAEMVWFDTADGIKGEPRLRLVRAMPKSNHHAWRLLFDELGYQPDFIVADAGTGLKKAIGGHFDNRTKFVPSMWHLGRAVQKALADTDGAFVNRDGKRRLREELTDLLAQLGRDTPATASKAGWRKWWQDMDATLHRLSLPVERIAARRALYEEVFADVVADLNRYPMVPISTGGLETLISEHVQPVLHRRRSGFANIERTNRLFDLVVCKEHGVFDDIARVARLLRQDADDEGFVPPLRVLRDPKGPGGQRYASLLDATLLEDLTTERGIA